MYYYFFLSYTVAFKMRFKFCGDADCPDWLLAEITTLSKLTSVKMKLLSTQVIRDIIGGKIDYEKVHKLTSDAKFDESDIKASIAALSLILTSGAKYNVNTDVLANELQQLGLPKEHTTSLCKVYTDGKSAVQDKLRETSLRLSQLESVNWRVDYVIGSSHLQSVEEPCVQLKLDIHNPDTKTTEPVAFTVSADKFTVLLTELKQAQSMMAKLKP